MNSRAKVIAQIKQFLDQYPEAEWGPAHLVLSDHNLADGHIT